MVASKSMMSSVLVPAPVLGPAPALVRRGGVVNDGGGARAAARRRRRGPSPAWGGTSVPGVVRARVRARATLKHYEGYNEAHYDRSTHNAFWGVIIAFNDIMQ